MKESKSVSLKNATINIEDNTITELTKDDEKVYDLLKILQDWNGIEGISITIKRDVDVPADE